MKGIALVAAGLVAGFSTEQIVHRRQAPAIPAATVTVPSEVAAPSPSPPATAPPAVIQPPALQAPAGISMEQLTARALANALAMERKQLLDAGFTPERIDWILGRRDELKALQSQQVNERRDKGLPPDPYGSRYMLDPDLDLRNEMSVEEYVQLRAATGRNQSVPISGVMPEGKASLAGLQDGDEVIAYGGTRVFNVFDLQDLASKQQSNGVVPLDIRRNGQSMQILVPGGTLAIRTPSVFEILLDR